MPQNEKFNAIVDAVCYWLGYQFKIGRDKLMHEASLRYPIADTLTAKGIPIDKINLEKAHPFFEDKIVDLITFDKKVSEINDTNFNNSISEIYEFKLAKTKTNTKYGDEHQRIVDDILRLAYFNLETGKDCYFLMCGKYDEFNAYFLGKTKRVIKNNGSSVTVIPSSNVVENNWNSTNSLYNDYFKFKINDSATYLFDKNEIPTDANEKQKKELEFGLSSFQARYKIKNSLTAWNDTLKLRTTCMAISLFELNPTKTHAAAIWKIEGIKEN